MGELSDAFLSLPGGVGTMDELFEAWSWSQVGLQDKPSGLLNVAGYYDELRGVRRPRAGEAGFMKPQHRDVLAVSADVGELWTLRARCWQACRAVRLRRRCAPRCARRRAGGR